MPRPCTACTHPDAAAVDEVLVSGASYRAVALAFGLNLSAIFRHARNHLAAPIRRRPCDVCRVRHAACRKAAKAEARRRVLDARKRRRAAEAWLLTADAQIGGRGWPRPSPPRHNAGAKEGPPASPERTFLAARVSGPPPEKRPQGRGRNHGGMANATV